MKLRRDLFQYNQAISSLRDLVAEIQGVANQPDDPVAQEGIGAVYALYHNRSFVADGLTNGVILVTCHADERNVPAVLGGPKDLNYDSDAEDDLGDVLASTDLKLVPVTLTVTFGTGSEMKSLSIHRLFSQTAF
ncbi:MAG: hypothetical protein ACKVX7_10280 [Planctomycetota bacterium]